MRYFRAFAVFCFSLGLFVQVAAQASATPQVQMENARDCSEMAQTVHGDMKMQPADEAGPCGMTLECLIAMNCIPPIALAGQASHDTPFTGSRTPYEPDGIVRLKGSPMPPESPPPQAALTA